MALYVSVTLLATLTALAEQADQGHVRILAVVWGTTVGLALVHWFAFVVSASVFGGGGTTRHDHLVSLAQLGGAGAVAVVGTLPVVVLSPTAELDTVRLFLAALVAAAGYAVGRTRGASRARASVTAAAVLVVALAVAVAKNVLSGH